MLLLQSKPIRREVDGLDQQRQLDEPEVVVLMRQSAFVGDSPGPSVVPTLHPRVVPDGGRTTLKTTWLGSTPGSRVDRKLSTVNVLLNNERQQKKRKNNSKNHLSRAMKCDSFKTTYFHVDQRCRLSRQT